jgi:tetratricopeptide (TPR) repeat protein
VLEAGLWDAQTDVWFRDAGTRARATIQRSLRELPLDSIPPADRPYRTLARLYALLGEPARVREMLAGLDSTRGQVDEFMFGINQHMIRGDLAIAERRFDDAIREYRAAEPGGCLACPLPDLARAYDLAGQSDSAIAVLSRFVSHPATAYGTIGWSFAGAHKRLGELYDAAGNRDNAMSHYASFVELWKNADAELQPQVKRARDRLQELQRGRG